MGAWKSSDGGSIAVVGASKAVVSPGVATVNVVTSGTNTKGVIIRTSVIRCDGANLDGRLLVGGHVVQAWKHSGTGGDIFNHLPRELFVPAGNAVQVQGVVGAPEFFISYDIM